MKKSVYILSFILLSVQLFSCQREVEDIFSQRVTADSSFLQRVVQLDTSFASGLDTIAIIQFSYDSRKRLVLTRTTWFDRGTHNLLDSARESRYYNGNDTFPYRVISQDNYAAGDVYDDTLNLYYSAAGIVQNDSIVSYSNHVRSRIEASLYTPAGTNRFRTTRKKYDGNTGLLLGTDTVLSMNTFTGANLADYSDSIYYNSAGTLDEVYHTTSTFDTQFNPYNRFVIPYPLYGEYLLSDNALAFNWQPPSVNNPLTKVFTHIITGSAPVTAAAQFQYQYNAAGYPVLMRATGNLFGNTLKVLLTYTNL